MAKIWEPYRGYTRCRHYTDLITRSCFRSIRIEGRERIPAEGAVILAPNHCATLLDPMLQLLLRPDKAPIAFGARSDIFANPRTAKILRWLRIVPIARERNGLNEVAKNFEVFDEIVDCLDHDVPFCMYAEGTHRAERGMLPVKKGLFRVAKMASDHLGKPVYIFPIGTCYEDFFRGQTRVRMRVGEPMEIGARTRHRPDRRTDRTAPPVVVPHTGGAAVSAAFRCLCRGITSHLAPLPAHHAQDEGQGLVAHRPLRPTLRPADLHPLPHRVRAAAEFL